MISPKEVDGGLRHNSWKMRRHNNHIYVVFLLAVTLSVGLSAKTPVLTIDSPDGDIIDCVDIRDQPAFDHPLLRDHKIYETPANLPNMIENEDEFIWQIWHQNGTRCPEGTIPIRRLNGTVNSPTNEREETRGHEYAAGALKNPPPKIYGAKFTLNVWQPKVEASEFSLGQIWVTAGSFDTNDLNTIEAGWQVYPHLYSDYQPRLFIFWTKDSYTLTKCYNVRCPGFVQTSRSIVIEGAISPTSTVGGTQMELTIQIWKDKIPGGPWWLGVGFSNGTVLSPIGYWPSEIFTRLNDYATNVKWGGEIVNNSTSGRHTTTQMGSGYLPGNAKAAYMRDLQIAANIGSFQPAYDLHLGATNPDYYRIKKLSDTSFSYGGPQHAGAGAVHIDSDSMIFYLCLGLFLLF